MGAGRKDNGVNGVARHFVTVQPIVSHRDSRPVRRRLESGIGRVGHRHCVQVVQLGESQRQGRGNIRAWCDELVTQHHRTHAFGISHLRRDDHLVRGTRLVRRMIHLPDVGRGVGGEDGVRRAGRDHTSAPRAAEVVVERWIHQLHGRPVTIRGNRPRELRAEIHIIHDAVRWITQRDAFAFAIQRPKPRTRRRDAVTSEQRRRILRHDEEAAGGNRSAVREGVVDAAAQFPQRQIHRAGGRVVQFDELVADGVVQPVVVNLVDDHALQRLDDTHRERLLNGETRAVGVLDAKAERRAEAAEIIWRCPQLVAGDGEERVVPEA